MCCSCPATPSWCPIFEKPWAAAHPWHLLFPPPPAATAAVPLTEASWTKVEKKTQWGQSHTETLHTWWNSSFALSIVREQRAWLDVGILKVWMEPKGWMTWWCSSKRAHHHHPSGKNEGPFSGCGLLRTQRFAHMHALTQKTLAHFKGLFYMINSKSTWKIAQLRSWQMEDQLSVLCGRFRRRSINEISSHSAWNASSIKLFFRTRVVTFIYVSP